MKRALTVVILVLLCSSADAWADQAKFEDIVQNVPAATGYRYAAHDNLGHTLDTLKVINNPQGGYIGVYHANVAGTFEVMLGTSSDLLTWKFEAILARSASQPTIARLGDRSFLVAFEQSGGCTGSNGPGGSCLRFQHYADISALLAARSDQTFQAPRTLSPCAEGTPNIYSAKLHPDLAHSMIRVGFHYFRTCQVDRQATGVLTNFSKWHAYVPTEPNALVQALGAVGNIGDRDAIGFGGGEYRLIEGQLVNGDFGSWRTFLFDRSTGAKLLTVHTHRGSTAFANPTASWVKAPGGGVAIVVTQFLPVQGAAPGEAGELVYYRTLASQSPPPLSSPCKGSSPPAGGYKHVVWVVFENHAYEQINGSSSAPHMNHLASECGLATNDHAVAHPSLPNYMALTSGGVQGYSGLDSDPNGTCCGPVSANNIFNQLGGNWRGLEDGMPQTCATRNGGTSYAVRHNPPPYYSNLTLTCPLQDRPLGATPDLSAAFTFVTPNTCNDMHDCSISTGDSWLGDETTSGKFMDKLFASRQWKAGNTAVFITFDEDDGSHGNHIYTSVIAPSVRPGTHSATLFDHYSLLATTEDLLRLPRLGNATGAPSLAPSGEFNLGP